MANGCVNDCSFSLPDTLDKKNIRCNNHGDRYMKAICDHKSGDYAKLIKLFDRGADLCDKTLKDKKIDLQNIKTSVKEAKKKCASQTVYLENNRRDFETQYEVSQEVSAALGK